MNGYAISGILRTNGVFCVKEIFVCGRVIELIRVLFMNGWVMGKCRRDGMGKSKELTPFFGVSSFARYRNSFKFVRLHYDSL